MTIEAVIFDWGGTLTPWHVIDLREQWLAYTAVYDPLRADELAGQLQLAEAASWAAAREEHRSSTMDELLRSAGIEADGPRHEEALAAFQAFWDPHTWTDPDVIPCFEGLRDRGILVGVLSNTLWTREYHEAVFARDGIAHLVDGAVFTSEIPWTKPHPEAFRAAMEVLDIDDPAVCVYVGDRPFEDIHGAKQVGMRAVLVPHSDIPRVQRGRIEGDPDGVIATLTDLLPLVDSWR